MPNDRQYVLVPRRGIRSTAREERVALGSLPTARSTAAPITSTLTAAGNVRLTVVDSVQEDGAKLVRLDDDAARQLNSPGSPVRALPVVYYDRPDRGVRPTAVRPLAATQSLRVECKSTRGVAVENAEVIVYEVGGRGDYGFTDANGNVSLSVDPNALDHVYVIAPGGYWSFYQRPVPAANPLRIFLDEIVLPYPDAVRTLYPASRFLPAAGVRVGVIDSGVGPHGDLNLTGGANTVTGEPKSQFQDGDQHGTHVAGLIGARGAHLRGLAPGVELRSYRVFGAGAEGASNYSILKAMIYAASDGCDVINLSLGGGPWDPIVEEAIADARNQGMLVVIAAGNGGRKAVSFPAAYAGATAVSAMGIEGTFPKNSLDESSISYPPRATHPGEFIASFSNVGPQIAVTGLGVGVLSTLPGGSYGPMSGTSMAAPVVAGAVASLLSQQPGILAMPRDLSRSNAIERLLQTSCVRRGFPAGIFEGYGLPDPRLV